MYRTEVIRLLNCLPHTMYAPRHEVNARCAIVRKAPRYKLTYYCLRRGINAFSKPNQTMLNYWHSTGSTQKLPGKLAFSVI